MLDLRSANKQKKSRQTSIQAPTGGLNAKDPLASMKETEAVTMDNYFPTETSVDSRNGCLAHVTGITGAVETVASYNNGVIRKLFGYAGGKIYDVTTAGSVGAAVVSGLTNTRFQTVTMGTAGGYFLLGVNGENKMQVYTGSAWYADGTTTSVTGFDTAKAAHITNFKNRVWFVEKESFRAWYLPVSSIGGAAANLDLSGLFKLGGYLMAMANWTIDNAAGIDDYAAFITSEGEVALYKGTDPSSASTWALVGTFRMGRPVGRRCFCKAGADVLVLTTDGAFPLSKALLTDRSQVNLAATDNIVRLFNADVAQYKGNFGWQPIIYPQGQKLIVNIPTTENVEARQYVMNTTHGAWCRFVGWNAFCFEVLDDVLYFGTNGAVFKADVGMSDNGASITGVVQQAYSYFRAPGIVKKFNNARPLLISEGTIVPAILMNVDYSDKRTTSTPYAYGSSGSAWDVSTWDVAPWTTGDNLTAQWQSVSGVGIAGGLRLYTELLNLSCKWVSTDVSYETGGVF